METFDVCVIGFCTFCIGMLIGLIINNKNIKNLQEELDYRENKYNNLIDDYTDCLIEKHKLQFEKYLKPIPPVKKDVVAKKKPGRPKGSKNKPKENGRPTTRKYTRKSSK